MILAGASLNQTPLDWANNMANILEAIKQAKAAKAEVLCLPELTITGYGCEDMFLHKWVADKAFEQLALIIPETTNMAVSVGLPMWFNDQLYNVACFIANGKIVGFQAKQNLPKDGVHYEPRWFEAWPSDKIENIDTPFGLLPFGDRIYVHNGVKIGFEICEDAWVTDRPACRLVEHDVDIILNPSASHFAIDKLHKRESLVVDSSKEFNCTYIYTNQLGNEAGRIIYDGDIVIAKKGELLANIGTLSFESIVFTAIDVNIDGPNPSNILTKIVEDRDSRFDEFTDAVTLGLMDYLRKSKSRGFVLSLSGGADSSSCLVLVAAMIRKGITTFGLASFLARINREDLIGQVKTSEEVTSELLFCAYQGTVNSSKETYEAAATLAESVGATFKHWLIDDNIDSAKLIIEQAIGRPLSWQTDDIALQNIQARMRSPLIWMVANINNALLITTSNRSEGSVGYATMDGDTSGSLAPLAGIDKPFLLAWLKWMYQERGCTGLQKVIELEPTAELRPLDQVQKDEDDLMPYPTLNRIEELFAKERLSPLAIYELLKSQEVDPILASQIIKFFKLWSRNQWKRERLAPSFQLSHYNIDPRSWFRFPILSGSFQDELKALADL
jgi:NAD+ synthase (glutamine-hydrolysing)